jgi:hypothetical protein
MLETIYSTSAKVTRLYRPEASDKHKQWKWTRIFWYRTISNTRFWWKHEFNILITSNEKK